MSSTYILIVAVILVIGWFAFGVIYNLRRGDAFLRWLQKGLPLVGERTTFRWLGSSVAEMVIAKPKKPFRRLEVLVALVPRDVPWLWLFAAAQGRHDTLILRADLLQLPHELFELADPRFWTGRLAIQQAGQNNWQAEDYQDQQLLAPPARLQDARARLEALSEQLARLAPGFARIALRRDPPNLEVHMPLPDRRTSAEALFTALIDLSNAIAREKTLAASGDHQGAQD